VRLTIGTAAGSDRLEQRVIRFAPGRSLARGPGPGRQEVLYVAGGAGTLHLGGEAHPLERDTGVFVAAGEAYEVENPGPDELVVLSVTTPEAPPADDGPRRVTVRFNDQPELRADANRTFRYLVTPEASGADVTQFVGIVQPSRAPDHSHTYDEVGYIVEGVGVAHMDGKRIPLSAGSCFHLPPELVHCIENNGEGVMRILGVFHPSGDPASRSYDAARSTNNEAESAS
jgi:mannose-6-phosphate isomerase-like protein (cupin superfamily)